MRRIFLWFASTVSVVALLFGYHTSLGGASPVTAGGQTAISGSASGDHSRTTSGNGSGNGAGGSGAGGNNGNGGSSAASSSTVTGDVAQTQWGPVQVELTVASGSITDVSVVQYPSGNGTDEQINSYALPRLIQETLNAQSSSIDMVSGATVTSTGYLQSLQSAIDQAGL
ncbi:FMN-binding protein [Nocardioides panacisoli]|uniref:FMN-binding protein n=1 Tax=Nocardioides panacisoli TaxID=627624 RepID=A0ABP7I0C1_9ACTN